MYFVAETCSHVESRDIVADAPPQVDGGGSNATTFTSGWCAEGDEKLKIASKLLGINYRITKVGSGRLPHQPYLKMQDFQVPGGVSPWFHKVVWGVIWQWEPGGWDSVDLRGRGDIVRLRGWRKRPAQATCHFPGFKFNGDYIINQWLIKLTCLWDIRGFKIMEKAILTKINKCCPHLISSKIYQIGFKEGKSTAIHASRLLNEVHGNKKRKLDLLIDL